MPIKVPADLIFAPGGTTGALDRDAVDDLLALARRVRSPQSRKAVLETFKEHFCRASGDPYNASSSLDWTETDLWHAASSAAGDSASFIVAFVDACEELEGQGATVPGPDAINRALADHGCPFRIQSGELIRSASLVASPESPLPPEDAVAMALADAMALTDRSGASSGIDRAHTALHGYLKHLCVSHAIAFPNDATSAKLFKLLRKGHPALRAREPRASDIARVLQSLAAVVDALAPIRNQASLAHPNQLLAEPEAAAALNSIRTVFRYVQDRVGQYESKDPA